MQIKSAVLKALNNGAVMFFYVRKLWPKLKESSSFCSILIFASGNLLTSVLSAAGGILQARWVTPEVMGEFRKYSILMGYLTVLLVVTNDGFARQYSYLIGKGKRNESELVAGSVKSWYLFAAWLATVIFILLMLYSTIRGDWMAVFGWATQIMLGWSTLYGAYLGILYRNAHDFKKLTVNTLAGSAVSFVLLITVKFFGFWGLCLRQLAGAWIGLWLTVRNVPLSIKPRLDFARLLYIAKIGIPMSLAGYLSTSLWSSTEALLILKCCGEKTLGLVSVALFIVGSAQTLTVAIHQVYTPQITQHFGHGDDFISSLRYTIIPTIANLLISLLIVLIGYMCIGPLVKWAIPNYVESVPIVQLLLWTLPLQALQMPFILLKANLMYWHLFIPVVIGLAFFIGVVAFTEQTVLWIISASLAGRVHVLLASACMVYFSHCRKTNE